MASIRVYNIFQLNMTDHAMFRHYQTEQYQDELSYWGLNCFTFLFVNAKQNFFPNLSLYILFSSTVRLKATYRELSLLNNHLAKWCKMFLDLKGLLTKKSDNFKYS